MKHVQTYAVDDREAELEVLVLIVGLVGVLEVDGGEDHLGMVLHDHVETVWKMAGI